MIQSKINYKRIAYHLLFWVLLVASFTSYSTIVVKHEFLPSFLIDILTVPTDIFAVYFVLYFLFPRFLNKKYYIQFIFVFLLFFVILVFFITMPYEYFILSKVYPSEKMKDVEFVSFIRYRSFFTVIIKLMIIGLASAIKLSKNWLESQKQRQKLEKEMLEAQLKLKESELNYLKSQINPHFLFNALNNLYSLILEKSDQAPNVLLKISALLSYMLYECNVPFISLDKEIEHIKNYVDIQKIRFGEDVIIETEYPIENRQIEIAPLLLLPFIENCFKHGLSENIGTGRVNIKIKASDKTLVLSTSNTIPEDTIISDKKEGIGIINIKKRLELQYKNRYQLDVEKKDNIFTVKLELTLSE